MSSYDCGRFLFFYYSAIIKSTIIPYFKSRKIALKDLDALDIQRFYSEQLKRVSSSMVIHYHTLLHRAMKYAVKVTSLIPIQ